MTHRAAFSTFGFRHSFVVRHSCFVILPHSSFVLRHLRDSSFVLRHLSDGNPPFLGRSRAVRWSAFPLDRRVRRHSYRTPSRLLSVCAACTLRRWNAYCITICS